MSPLSQKYFFILQDSWEESPWTDHDRGSFSEIKKLKKERVSDEVWTQGGKRRWRMIRRCVTESLVPDYDAEQ